jgi:hypothetical protein
MSEINNLMEDLDWKLEQVQTEHTLDGITSAWNLLWHIYEENKESEPFKHLPWAFLKDGETVRVYEDNADMDADDSVDLLKDDNDEKETNESKAEIEKEKE